MLIDAQMIVTDIKHIRRSCNKDIGPYWLKIAPKTPLEGLEVEYAKAMGFEPWDDWAAALRSFWKGSRADRKEFLRVWLDDVDHARTVAGKEIDNSTIYLPVWR